MNRPPPVSHPSCPYTAELKCEIILVGNLELTYDFGHCMSCREKLIDQKSPY